MLCSSARIHTFSLPNNLIFFISRRPRFSTSHIPAICHPIRRGYLSFYPKHHPINSKSSTRPTLFSALRSDQSMATQSSSPQSIHDFTVKDARGNDVDLSKYKGKVLLIVNVASQCGLTNSNYTELAQLYEKYKDQDHHSGHLTGIPPLLHILRHLFIGQAMFH